MRPIQKTEFDTTVRPEDDFYRYVNGGWCSQNEIPATQSRWGSFDILHQKNQRWIRKVLHELKSKRKNDELKKLSDLYESSMDMRKRNRQGLTYLQPSFDVIESLSSHRDFPRVFAHLHRIQMSGPWRLWFDQDDKESRRMVLRIGQGGLGVPDRGYHLKTDKESKRIREAYRAHIDKMLKLADAGSAKEREKISKTVFKIERQLARVSKTPVEQRDTHALYNKRTEKQLKGTYRNFNWDEYFDLIKLPEQARQHVIVDNPAFLAEVNKMLKRVSVDEWKAYLRWHLLFDFAGTTSEPFINERFQYQGKALFGQKQLPELWKRSVGTAISLMEDAIGKLYVKEFFPPSSKKKITELVENLITAYRDRIKRLDWMSPKTKKKALEKLGTITLQLGYPEKWESYSKLKITDESFVQNMISAVRFHFDLEMSRLAKPTDPRLWPMPAALVNAMYSPNLNQITFPAAILQPPFFYPDADEAVNYGAIGSVIGHELTHAFDDQGSKFDKNGNLNNWWTKKDKEQFEKRADILVKQFNKFEVADGIRVNGRLTLGENIADLGGIVIAYEAFKNATRDQTQKKISGFTPEQRFFISYAITERTLVRDEFNKFAALNDPHSPSVFRVNGIVSHSEDFYKAFNISTSDMHYLPVKKRAVIW